ncbi:septum formation family protein [Longispora albida]|uniref:septum formation family protein n=1 Tax=Longispora albida TaxID=203523 RepID=UPI0003626770|nr:septum formation family protein [Longispora albida]
MRTLGVLLLSCLLLAGCTVTVRTDAEVTGLPPVPVPPVLRADECWRSQGPYSASRFPKATGTVVPCSEPHEFETYYSGPLVGTPGKAQLDLCTLQAKAILGADYLTGRVELEYFHGPDWFSCVMAETSTIISRKFVARTGRLHDALKNPGMQLGCADLRWENNSLSDIAHVADCSGAHTAEFTGFVELPVHALPSTAADLNTMAIKQCEALGVKYLGGPNAEVFNIWIGPLAPDLKPGNHFYRCFLGAPKGKRFASVLKGLGTKPIPYA